MSPHFYRLLTTALPLAAVVACTKPAEKMVQAKPTPEPSPVAAPAKSAPAPATSSKDQRRPLQPWAHYWLTD